ncbi:MAG TPA: hypothetical protein DDY52_03300 [Candidatus Moranbacteria bacterium]|nr:hypothetical protein [Candidatus Moranbacteria bacterium]
MDNLGTKTTSIKYQTKALQKFFQRSMYVDVVNDNFEAQNVSDPKMKKKVDKKFKEFVVTTLTGGGWKSTDGVSTITYTKVTEVISRLIVGTFLEIADEIPSVAAFASAVEDPDSEIINQAGQALYEEMDQAILAFYADAAAGNWLGTSYVTGTVTITVTTGAVVGVGTTFAASMVGKPFRADGHSKWFRVKTFTDTTHIVIEDDSDDTDSAYTGGAIAGGSSYEIQANTCLAITQSNFKYNLDVLSGMLKGAPNDGKRWLALPELAAKPVLLKATELNPSIKEVFDETVAKGKVAKASGFDLYFLPDEWFTGDNTDGFMCVGGHKSFITGAFGYIENISTIKAEQNPNGHSDLIKGLFGHGEKVADERRKAGVAFYAKFNLA